MYPERPLLGICSDRSRVEKRPSRFSFIRVEAFIPHPFGCNKRYESRVQFLMRTHSATFTARCVIGDAKKSCAGNLALRANCKWRGELRFMQSTARMPCRTFADWLRIFAQQKYGSEGGCLKSRLLFPAYEFKIKSLYRRDLILNIA